MSDNLEVLRKIAEAATPGPWKWDEPSKDEWPMEDQSLIQSEGDEPILSGWGYDASGTLAEDVDRTHIATFDPPTVLALLSRLEHAEQAVARVREVCESDSYDMHKGYGNGELAVPVDSIMNALDGETRG